MITYIDIVNNILKRLREREVTTVNETTYSTLIAILVNDAKDEVENAWDWSGLRKSLTAQTTAGLFSYELQSSGNKPTIIDVINDTANAHMTYKGVKWFNNAYLNNEQVFGVPTYYGFNGISSDGDTQIDIYPVPDATYQIVFNIIDRTGDLLLDSDTLVSPKRPVELLAYAKAIEERGEDAGVNSSSAYFAAKKALSDEISYDVSKHPEETLYYAV